MESGGSDHRKKPKEQDLQKRRNAQSHGALASSSKPGGPLFGELIEKKDGDLRIKNILGSYDEFLGLGDQRTCFGVTNTTPSTPLPLHNKHINPFDSNFSTSSLTTSHTGTSSSRHQVAQPPNGQSVSSIKRDKTRQSSKLTKSESKSSSVGDKTAESKPILTQPTNILRVNKMPNKAAVKPYKATSSQKKTSPHKPPKPKVKKSHSSQLIAPTQPQSSDTSANSTQTLSHKTKKPSSVSVQQDSFAAPSSQLMHAPGAPPMKRVSSAGAVSVKTEKDAFKVELPKPSDSPSKETKRKKKKKVKKRESEVKLEPHPTGESHPPSERQESVPPTSLKVQLESIPTSLKVQLPKQQERPNDLHINVAASTNEDTTVDAESVSSMLKELMNPLPSTLVTPIPTPIKSGPFIFPTSVPQLPVVSQAIPHLQSTRLCSTSSEEELEDTKNREALAAAISTIHKDLAGVSDHTHLHEGHQQTGSMSSSGNSSSDESSSDSSSDSETEEVPLFSLPTTTITPIKQTPPHKLADFVISPLAHDESANLSPAKKIKSVVSISKHISQPAVSQSSIGFNPAYEARPEQVSIAHPAMVDCDVSDSDSSGSSSDSGSESDSESSDSEDQAFDVTKPKLGQSNAMSSTNLNLSQSSEEGLPFDSSGGFMEGTDFFTGLSNVQAPPSCTSLPITSHTLFESDSTAPFTVMSNPVGLNSNSTVQSSVPTLSVGEPLPHGKRRNLSSPRTARKRPKLTIKEAASTVQNLREEEPHKRTISITSSEYHSEEGEVTSEPEDQPVFLTQPVTAAANQIAQQSYVGTQSSQPTTSQQSTVNERMETLVVRLPLADLKRVPDQNKPKATVEPYNIRQTSDSRVRRPLESDQVSNPRAHSRERSEGRGREGYGSVSGGRHRDEYGRPYHRDRPGDRPRSRRDVNRWDRESSRDRRYPPDDRSSRHMGGRGWEYPHDDYWTDDHSEYGGSRARRVYGGENQSYPERYMSEARRKKHEADKIQSPGVDKAKAYMDSVVLFMKYGDATEQQSESSSNSAPKKSSAFRTYNETLAMIKYCQNMANDCKPLVILCMRCQSVLLWRMYLIKLPTAAAIQKELQEYFIPPKGTQGKSPYPNSTSPLPSPASVGSTTSTGSGGWTSTQDPSPSGSVTVPKHIVNKATEHLTISNYVSHSVELWKSSETLMYQCRDYFSREDRSAGQRLSHCSAVSHVANWTEKVLRNFRYSTY